MAARKESIQHISSEEFITDLLDLPTHLKIQITRVDRTRVEFDVVAKRKQQKTLVKVRVGSDYCYLFDLLTSSKASLKEKFDMALKKAKDTGQMQSLIYNIPGYNHAKLEA